VVERDDQESHSRQPAEQPHVGAATQRDAVQEDQRNATPADGDADPTASSTITTRCASLTRVPVAWPAADV
jgi:hypothetical protein